MAEIIYSLCALTALLCTCLLLYAYRNSRYQLLLWGGLCFMGLTINNILVVIDELVVPLDDLSLWRLWSALAAMIVLLYGLIFKSQ